MGIRQQTIDDYGAFVDKFKPKKTTDDCYTPPEVYETIKDWACREFGIDPSKVVRPFYPGDDYESFDYSDGKVVVDNPPKYAYPRELLTVSRLGKIGKQVEFCVKASDVAFTRALDSQKAVKKAIFGGGYLLSENKAAELKAAELKAAEDVTVWPLSDSEKRIIENLA